MSGLRAGKILGARGDPQGEGTATVAATAAAEAALMAQADMEEEELPAAPVATHSALMDMLLGLGQIW